MADRVPLRVFQMDLNWSRLVAPLDALVPSAPSDWAEIDAAEYFRWHRDFGVNTIFCQAYTYTGYAFYPTRLGPVAPGSGSSLLPRLYDMAAGAGLPFIGYFCVGADPITADARDHWVVPGSHVVAIDDYEFRHGFLAPESPWTDLLCDRVHEFLSDYPTDWILFDFLCYGSTRSDLPLEPAWFAREPFEEIVGRPMPDSAGKITADESLAYKRAVLARQFQRLRDTVRGTSPKTKIMFNPPFWYANETLWEGHPMLAESDALFAESSRADIMEWLLARRQPHQRVFTTVVGRLDDPGWCDPLTWKRWVDRGCDIMGYAWATPPDFRPHPDYVQHVEILRAAFAELSSHPRTSSGSRAAIG